MMSPAERAELAVGILDELKAQAEEFRKEIPFEQGDHGIEYGDAGPGGAIGAVMAFARAEILALRRELSELRDNNKHQGIERDLNT